MIIISSNHSKILAIHETSHEYGYGQWYNIFEESCEIPFIKDSLTKVYEDNVDCITQIKTNDRTKHIFLKFLYILELQDKSEINVK